ncbi:flagellar hook-length control protein FliK [Scandinavium manionii]|uniref:flagellar hook-length control protein FliK n=1 Tax=Scandinavium manionii TaxID=2926520 RepID=UPI0021664901|nr:flagellar hook-length control protein FliK [Scandinavium manionii]MCS2166893.1 flagellar hook-length control protein FliK [Scandinavium manionii]
MNSVQAAVSALLEKPESSAAVQTQSDASGDFSLENTASGVVSRHRTQPAKEESQKDDAIAQDLSALMATLLTPPVATKDPEAPGSGSAMLKSTALAGTGSAMLKTTALAGADARTLVKLMGMMSAKSEVDDAGASEPVLPQALQALLSKNSDQASQGTAAQQATLAKLAAQNLHSIGSTQRTTAATTATTNRPTLHENLHTVLKTTAPQHAVNVIRQPDDTPLTTIAAMSDLTSRPVSGTDSPSPVLATPVTDTSMDDLGEKLNNILKDRIQFQLDNQQQMSTIRLDPPSMGKLEIVVHLDANQNLNVHIGASQADVMKTLQQFSDHLRQHLVQQNFMQVNVQVSPDGQSQQQHQQRQDEEVTILSSRDFDDAPELTQNESVLLKV